MGDILQALPFKPFLKEVEKGGKYEIIQQGNDPIIGFANGTPCNDYEDIVIFGDHTLSLYKPNRPFFVATDGVRIIKGKENIDGFYLLSLLEKYKPKSEGYKRYYGILTNSNCFITMQNVEQQQIGSFFRSLDDLITLHQRKQIFFKRLRKSILDKTFTSKNVHVPQIRLKNYTYAWEQRKLNDIADKVIEKNAGLQYVETFTNSAEYGVISQRDFFDHDISKMESLDGYYIVREEDFVYNPRISVTAPVGPINRNKLGRIGVMSPLYTVFRTHDVDTTYLEHFFKSVYWHSFMRLNGDSGARSDRFSIKDSLFFEMPIPYPDIVEQRKIGEWLTSLDSLITLHQRKLKILKNLKRALLERMFIQNRKEPHMVFTKESDFEQALVDLLGKHGWSGAVLQNYTPQQLLQNWKNILSTNNNGIDRLNGVPLTDGEMQQILEQINDLRTPLELNKFVKGRYVHVVRDDPADALHFGKEIALEIYNEREIAAGKSVYQIARQPQFPTRSALASDRRGDVMLLINGMPLIHIELKRSGVPVSQATEQIKKYAHEGVFTGLFSLVQVFVAMNPDQTVYFANPGLDGRFDPSFYFHWADFDNEPINEWNRIVASLLSIPMAHQLIGYYTVADDSDGILKVMRSYQYYAASAISDKVAKMKWESDAQRGGYIWHTTGSGKTMTSFKSAQLIAASNNADKVIFLVDRIELGTQSLREYRGFADEDQDVQATENTGALVNKLKSPDPANTLIVTSIQKMSNIRDEAEVGLKADDIAIMNAKRIVFIVDECHRSTFGDMLLTIKQTFPRAVFFGFTGTPIQEENQKKHNTTATVFGNELHRYSIADGIRDKNVLGFDPYKMLTFKDKDLRREVALEKVHANSFAEAMADPQKRKAYYEIQRLPMAGYTDDAGVYHKGIEDYLPNSQNETPEHQSVVVQDIVESFPTLSHGGTFHAIFATSSIPEAITYYRLLKEAAPELKVAALFDPSIDNNGGATVKEDGLLALVQDYNERYGQSFTVPTFGRMKKDIAARLAHKRPYARIAQEPEKQIDLLVVVDQMLTGFDSKWVNTLYLDKLLQYENIIQAFSRTNRLFDQQLKPFGTIKYYRRPHTMEKRIAAAVKLYSGDKPLGLFVERLNKNLEHMNFLFEQICDVFKQAGVEDFLQLPAEISERKKFADLFRQLNDHLAAARVQGFVWQKQEYTFTDADSGKPFTIQLAFDETTYKILALRYKELLSAGPDKTGGDVPYNVEGYLTEIDTEKIDADYMNSRFVKYLELLHKPGANAEAIKQAEADLHKTFATLSQEEQRFAELFLHDIQRGDVTPQPGKTFRDYITEYMSRAKDDQIHRLAIQLGLDESQLRALMALHVTEANINEYGRFDALKATVDRNKARHYLEWREGAALIPPKVNIKVDALLRKFILSGGFDVEQPSED